MPVKPIKLLPLSTIATLMALVLAAAPDDIPPFRAAAADSYAHQTAGQITVGAKSFDNPSLVERAFGKKIDLLKYGIVPVLVVVENKGRTPVDLRALQVNLVATDGRHASAVSPDQLYSLARSKPKTTVSAPPLPFPTRSKKNPLTSPELVERSFTAKIIPPNDSASGFFYFEAHPETGDKLYLDGMRDARSQKDVMYFEFELTP